MLTPGLLPWKPVDTRKDYRFPGLNHQRLLSESRAEWREHTSALYILIRPWLTLDQEGTALMFHSWLECSAKGPVFIYKERTKTKKNKNKTGIKVRRVCENSDTHRLEKFLSNNGKQTWNWVKLSLNRGVHAGKSRSPAIIFSFGGRFKITGKKYFEFALMELIFFLQLFLV